MQTKFEVFIRIMFAFCGREKFNCNLLQCIRIEDCASASIISAYRSETRGHCGAKSYNCVQRSGEFAEISSKLVNLHAYYSILLFVL